MPQAPIIGRQWFSWGLEDAAAALEGEFRTALAPARMVFASVQVRTPPPALFFLHCMLAMTNSSPVASYITQQFAPPSFAVPE